MGIVGYQGGSLPGNDEYTVSLKSAYDLDDPNIKGDSGDNSLAPMGHASRYDFGISGFTQPLTISGYEGTDQ